jgi:solute carrier family 30 (zinc transporter), member 2
MQSRIESEPQEQTEAKIDKQCMQARQVDEQAMRKLVLATAVTVVFITAQVTGGYIAGSVAI